jgi:hypothetical protein
MSSNQDFWLDQLEALGGQFWPPNPPEVPEPGAPYPRMLYRNGEECAVYDEEEEKMAMKNGFDWHPSYKKVLENRKKETEKKETDGA